MPILTHLLINLVGRSLGFIPNPNDVELLSFEPRRWCPVNVCIKVDRLGMAPLDCKRLLAAANLAHYCPKWGFTLLVDRWKMFIKGHHFYTSNSTGSFKVKVDAKNLNFDALILGTSAKHRRRVHVIQIGVSTTDLSPKNNEEQIGRDGLLITTPPRLNGLGIKTQSFQRKIDPFIWNFIVENNMDGKEKSSSSSSSVSSTWPSSSTTTTLPHPCSFRSLRKRRCLCCRHRRHCIRNRTRNRR